VAADGHEEQPANRLPVVDGVVTAPVGPPVAEIGGFLTVAGSGRSLSFAPPLSDRARSAAAAPIEPVDPRGLRGSVDEAQLQTLLHEMAGAYGLAPRMISPTLLAAGPVGDTGDRAILVGATMLTGATVAWLGVAGTGPGEPPLRTVATVPAPAGTALLGRVLAVPAGWAVSRLPLPPGDGPPGWLVISGPREGTAAEVQSAGTETLATLPLADGAAVAAVPPGTAGIRVLDATGAALGRAPVAELPG
jgi:hypothetical protein